MKENPNTEFLGSQVVNDGYCGDTVTEHYVVDHNNKIVWAVWHGGFYRSNLKY